MPALRLHSALFALAAACLLWGGTPRPADAFVETHLNEITAPVADHASLRLDQLNALETLTKAQKRERKELTTLARKLAKTADRLAVDFKELKKAGATSTKLLGTGGLRAAMDEAFARAELALGERVEFTDDHTALLTNEKQRAKIAKLVSKYSAARTDAAAQTTDKKRAKFLSKAEVAISKALKKAEKLAQEVVATTPGLSMPPLRLRSGDLVGAGGARVAVPIDSDSPLAGASVVIPPGAISNPTRITIEAGDEFVGGRDTAIGPAARFLPAGVVFDQPVRVALPFTAPPGSDDEDRAVFRFDGVDQTATLDTTVEPNGTLSGEFSSFAEFQVGLLAPPEGAPDGTYLASLFAVSHALPPAAPARQFAILQFEIEFAADGTAALSTGGNRLSVRTYDSASPHHTDSSATSILGSSDVAWTQQAFGEFSFDMPTPTQPIPLVGKVSTSGDVVSLTGRAAGIDVFGVAIRAGTASGAQALAGRWAAVELGGRLVGGAATPFGDEVVATYTSFTVDGATGDVAFEPTGEVFAARTDYGTNVASALHTPAAETVADGGTESWLVLPGGALQTADFRTRGTYNAEQGVVVSAFHDVLQHQVTLRIAVRQSASVPAGTASGEYRFARIDLAPTTTVPAGRSSVLDVETGTGTLSVTGTTFDLAFDSVLRGAVSLSNAGSLGTLSWTLAESASDVTPPPDSFDVTFDAAGNHRPGLGARYYGVSDNGDVVLTAAPDEGARVLRGVGIGLR